VEWVVVALPAEDLRNPPFVFPRGVILVEGGEERGDSVRRALAAVPPEADTVLVHDGARPLLSDEVVERVLAAVVPEGAAEGAAEGTVEAGAVAAVPVSDTLKRVGADGAIEGTVERRGLWRAQTPQAFPRRMIDDAYRRAAADGVAATDDAALVERYGGRVVVVEGDVRNLKLTRPEDLTLAELLLGAPTSQDLK
jgi:2-C-methyl-D-erythritol 4-phosphate cytidylyltransferase